LQWLGFLSFHGGSDEGDAYLGEFGFKRIGAVALVRDEDPSRTGEVGSIAIMSRAMSRSSCLAEVNANATGDPDGVVIKGSRRPQK